MTTTQTVQNQILRRRYTDVVIKIGACDGSRTIAKIPGMSLTHVDAEILNKDFDKPDTPTTEMEVYVYELAQNAKFSEMFNSLSSNRDALCLSKHQIVEFCEKHADKLSKRGISTFFLLKENDQYCVVCVMAHIAVPVVNVLDFEREFEWGAKMTYRVVIPKQKS